MTLKSLRWSVLLFLFHAITLHFSASPNKRFQLAWPSPNPAFARGMGFSSYIQKTGPDKEFSSGTYGCVRNNGYKFHEGLDLFPIKSDSRGKAVDLVFAAMPGKVQYINRTPGYSAYGKFIVIEHLEIVPNMYSLYAHLESIDKSLSNGSMVNVAQSLGRMGNTASYPIPLSRSHLHFEMGLRLTNKFQDWYNRQKFPTPNRHGNYSGFNLVGINPLPFYSSYKSNALKSPLEFFKSLPIQAKIRIRTTQIPDFTQRYPSLCSTLNKTQNFEGWDCSFGPFGIPLRLEQITGISSKDPMIKVLSFDTALQEKPCRRLIERKGSQLVPSKQLKTYLELIFNLKVH